MQGSSNKNHRQDDCHTRKLSNSSSSRNRSTPNKLKRKKLCDQAANASNKPSKYIKNSTGTRTSNPAVKLLNSKIEDGVEVLILNPSDLTDTPMEIISVDNLPQKATNNSNCDGMKEIVVKEDQIFPLNKVSKRSTVSATETVVSNVKALQPIPNMNKTLRVILTDVVKWKHLKKPTVVEVEENSSDSSNKIEDSVTAGSADSAIQTDSAATEVAISETKSSQHTPPVLNLNETVREELAVVEPTVVEEVEEIPSDSLNKAEVSPPTAADVFITVCRTCLKPTPSNDCHKLYDTGENYKKCFELRQKIMEVTESIDFYASSDPQVCDDCFEMINAAFAFRKRVKNIEEQVKRRKAATGVIDLKDVLEKMGDEKQLETRDIRNDSRTTQDTIAEVDLEQYLAKRKRLIKRFMSKLETNPSDKRNVFQNSKMTATTNNSHKRKNGFTDNNGKAKRVRKLKDQPPTVTILEDLLKNGGNVIEVVQEDGDRENPVLSLDLDARPKPKESRFTESNDLTGETIIIISDDSESSLENSDTNASLERHETVESVDTDLELPLENENNEKAISNSKSLNTSSKSNDLITENIYLMSENSNSVSESSTDHSDTIISSECRETVEPVDTNLELPLENAKMIQKCANYEEAIPNSKSLNLSRKSKYPIAENIFLAFEDSNPVLESSTDHSDTITNSECRETVESVNTNLELPLENAEIIQECANYEETIPNSKSSTRSPQINSPGTENILISENSAPAFESSTDATAQHKCNKTCVEVIQEGNDYEKTIANFESSNTSPKPNDLITKDIVPLSETSVTPLESSVDNTSLTAHIKCQETVESVDTNLEKAIPHPKYLNTSPELIEPTKENVLVPENSCPNSDCFYEANPQCRETVESVDRILEFPMKNVHIQDDDDEETNPNSKSLDTSPESNDLITENVLLSENALPTLETSMDNIDYHGTVESVDPILEFSMENVDIQDGDYEKAFTNPESLNTSPKLNDPIMEEAYLPLESSVDTLDLTTHPDGHETVESVDANLELPLENDNYETPIPNTEFICPNTDVLISEASVPALEEPSMDYPDLTTNPECYETVESVDTNLELPLENTELIQINDNYEETIPNSELNPNSNCPNTEDVLISEASVPVLQESSMQYSDLMTDPIFYETVESVDADLELPLENAELIQENDNYEKAIPDSEPAVLLESSMDYLDLITNPECYETVEYVDTNLELPLENAEIIQESDGYSITEDIVPISEGSIPSLDSSMDYSDITANPKWNGTIESADPILKFSPENIDMTSAVNPASDDDPASVFDSPPVFDCTSFDAGSVVDPMSDINSTPIFESFFTDVVISPPKRELAKKVEPLTVRLDYVPVLKPVDMREAVTLDEFLANRRKKYRNVATVTVSKVVWNNKKCLDANNCLFKNKKRKQEIPKTFDLFDEEHDQYFEESKEEPDPAMVEKWQQFGNRVPDPSEPPYLCEDCGKFFPDLAQLKEHAIESATAVCPYCDIRVKNSRYLKDHLLSRHTEPRFECRECGKKYTTKRNLAYHVWHMHRCANRTGQCQICGVVLKSSSLRVHMTRHSTGKVTCDICKKVFSNKARWDSHYRRHFAIKSEIPCPICSKVIKSKSNMKKHMRAYHEGTETKTCNVCGKFLSRRQSLERHMKIVHGPKTRMLDAKGKRDKETLLEDEIQETADSSRNVTESSQLPVPTGAQIGSAYDGFVEAPIHVEEMEIPYNMVDDLFSVE